MKGGWELRAKSHFVRIAGSPGIPSDPRWWVPGGQILCAGCGPESQKLGIGWPNLTNIHKYLKIWSKTTQNVKVSKKGRFWFWFVPEGRLPQPRGIFSSKNGVPKGPIGSVVLIPEENIVVISEQGNGFMSITEKLIIYKENWKLRFSQKCKITCKYPHKVRFWQKHELFPWLLRSFRL